MRWICLLPLDHLRQPKQSSIQVAVESIRFPFDFHVFLIKFRSRKSDSCLTFALSSCVASITFLDGMVSATCLLSLRTSMPALSEFKRHLSEENRSWMWRHER